MEAYPSTSGWIETYTGKLLHFLDPKPEEIDIRDIAHALSINNRFSGQSVFPVSVAEHSLAVSKVLKDQGAHPLDQFTGLMHDASEAYLVDIASPIKIELPQYKALEQILMVAIASKFNFSWPLPEEIHKVDRFQTQYEARYLMPGRGKNWSYDIGTWQGIRPVGHDWAWIEDEFLERFDILCGQIG